VTQRSAAAIANGHAAIHLHNGDLVHQFHGVAAVLSKLVLHKNKTVPIKKKINKMSYPVCDSKGYQQRQRIFLEIRTIESSPVRFMRRISSRSRSQPGVPDVAAVGGATGVDNAEALPLLA
jgi:hypothetical protein